MYIYIYKNYDKLMYLLVIGLKMLSVTTGSLLYVSLILKHLAVLSYLSKYLSLFVISDIF